jgi:hypothetical protein
MRIGHRVAFFVLISASILLAGTIGALAFSTAHVASTTASSTPNAALPPNKQAAQDQENAWNSAAAQRPPAPKHPGSAPRSCPEALPSPTILPSEGDAGYAKGYAHIQNIAQLTATDGHGYLVYGGALTSDPSQGIVMVITTISDPCANPHQQSDITTFKTPARSGAVQFTRLQGDLAYFQTSTGTSGDFNVLTHRFGV